MSLRLSAVMAGLFAIALIGTASAEEPKKESSKEAKKVVQKKEMRIEIKEGKIEGEFVIRVVKEPAPMPIPVGYGTPYTSGPPAYGWGYAWGNPWPANWGPAYVANDHKVYNFVPYYERMVIPPQAHVIVFVHPPAPFVPVNQLPSRGPQSLPTWEPRRVQVEVVPAKQLT